VTRSDISCLDGKGNSISMRERKKERKKTLAGELIFKNVDKI